VNGHAKSREADGALYQNAGALRVVYWFDFGDDWFHQVQAESIDQAIPTATYPRVIKRVGKSLPKYSGS
jgi:hypothetical protein